MAIGKRRIPTDEQVEEARIMVELDPDNQDCRSVLGRILYMKGELDEACEEYKRALQLDSNDAYSMFGLAQIYSDNDEPEKAMDHLLTAVEMEPENAEFRYALGDVLYAMGRFVEAHYHLTKICELEPNHESALELLEIVDERIMTGNPKDGIFVYDRKNQLTEMTNLAGFILTSILRITDPERTAIHIDTTGGGLDNHFVVLGVCVLAIGITRDMIESEVRALTRNSEHPIRIRGKKRSVLIEVLPIKRSGD